LLELLVSLSCIMIANFCITKTVFIQIQITRQLSSHHVVERVILKVLMLLVWGEIVTNVDLL